MHIVMTPKSLVALPQGIVYEKDPKVLQSIILSELYQLDQLEYQINDEYQVLMRYYMDIKQRNGGAGLLDDGEVSRLKDKLLILRKQERALLDQQRDVRKVGVLSLDFYIQKARDQAYEVIYQAGLKRCNAELLYKYFAAVYASDREALISSETAGKERFDCTIAELTSMCEKRVLEQVNELKRVYDYLQKACADVDKIYLDIRKQETWLSTLYHQIKICGRK